MQFRHWSALGPSQPWSPHSGWQGPAGDTSSGRGTEAEEGPRGLGGHSRSLPGQPNTGTHLTVHTGVVGRGFFWVWVCCFSSPAAPGTNLWRQCRQAAFFFFSPHLLISPSCCPTHHSSSLPTPPAHPVHPSFCFGGSWGLLPAYSSSSSATSTWPCRKAALDGSISGASGVLTRGWGAPSVL